MGKAVVVVEEDERLLELQSYSCTHYCTHDMNVHI